jgi:hypothetical protein
MMFYARIKDLTIEEIIERAMPFLANFVAGYQAGESEQAAAAGNGHDAAAPWVAPTPPPRGRKRRTKAKKAAKAAAKAETKAKAPKKRAPPKAGAATAAAPTAGAPSVSKLLDEHVLKLLQARGDWMKIRDLIPLVPGVEEAKVRKALGRLQNAGLVVGEGATKGKTYKAK